MFDSHQNADWSSYLRNVNYDFKEGESMVNLYLEHFAFESKGVLTEFRNKEHKFLLEHVVIEIEQRVSVYLAQNGLAGIKNKDITPAYYK
jgi:hypothetical protein